MNRRTAMRLIVFAGTACLTGCTKVNQATAPSETTSSTLLARLQALGYNATRVPYGNNGAARIAINSDVNWNFYVDGNLIGLSGGAPTIDDSVISVSSTSTIAVTRPS